MRRPVSPALLTAVALAATTLVACNRDKAPEGEAAPAPVAEAAVTPADAAADLTYRSTSPWATVSLTLPDAIKPHPDLHARLYAEEVRKLRQFAEGAQGDLTEAGAESGGEGDSEGPRGPYENTITVTAAHETGKLLSLKRVAFDYTGGANPNTISSGILWDKSLKRRIDLTDLLKTGTDTALLDQALCSAINTAKRARVPDSASITLNGQPGGCPRARDVGVVLTPGSVGGKAAGLTFLIGAYQVGSRVEGDYEIAIPLAVFRSLLSAAYIDEFAGQLARAGDVTPRPVAAPAA